MAACTADTTGDHRRAGLAFHLLPGFHNLRWMPPEAAGPHSPPYSFWFNADKALLPFVLIIIIPQLFVTAPLRRVTRLHWLLLAFSVPALLLLATALGGLGFEPHLPRWLPAFMLANLFFVSLAEEALFQGYSAGAFGICRPMPRCLLQPLSSAWHILPEGRCWLSLPVWQGLSTGWPGCGADGCGWRQGFTSH